MPHITQRCRHRLPHLFRHCLQMAHLRSCSPLGITRKRSTLPTNWKSTSNSLQRTLKFATQFSGGQADEVNFHISFSWHATFFIFLVSILVTLIHIRIWLESDLSLTGSAVAVERIFSGGWDTISQMCQSSSQHNLRTYACQEALVSYQMTLGLWLASQSSLLDLINIEFVWHHDVCSNLVVIH